MVLHKICMIFDFSILVYNFFPGNLILIIFFCDIYNINLRLGTSKFFVKFILELY